MKTHDAELDLRKSATARLTINPNYFGNLDKLGLTDLPKAVLSKVGDTGFEELTCIGYNPDTEVLTAIVRIKQGSGYGGGPCLTGTTEYVRFFIDWGSGWVDHGIAGFNIHDLGFDNPLCYAVSIKVDPQKQTRCKDDPVLPRVRGILSWNNPPPAGVPDWPPVWGNVLDRRIQVDPRSLFDIGILEAFEPGVLQLEPDIAAKLSAAVAGSAIMDKPPADMTKIMARAVKEGGLALKRAVTPLLAAGTGMALKADIAALNPQPLPPKAVGLTPFPDDPSLPPFPPLPVPEIDIGKLLKVPPLWPDLDLDLGDLGNWWQQPDFNTTYEELHCVGLDRDRNLLHGVVEVKLSSGYSGGLCTAGSREYIAFYLDFGSGWEYQGTTWVTVHDVAVPKGGLWYQASLPVNLDAKRKAWCETGRARIRGVLSWNIPPAPNQPDHVPHWGNRADCAVEVRPWPAGIIPGTLTPVLEAIGNMPVAQISGGYANGPSIGATFGAHDSPFGGAILFSGVIANPSNLSLEYRVMVKGPSDATLKPFTKSFPVYVTTVSGGSVSFSNQTQIATGDWFDYLPGFAGGIFTDVAGKLLQRFAATEDGLHHVRIDIRQTGGGPILSTGIYAFMVDNTHPVAAINITSGGGNCSRFAQGEPLSGTFSFTDKHVGSFSIYVTPGGAPTVITQKNGMPQFPPTATLSYGGGATGVPGTGATGLWEVDTSTLPPCGYNVWITGSDRTIVDSSGTSWQASDVRGFCVI
jgi:hypothetical protein